MCGIFGYIVSENACFSGDFLKKMAAKLAVYSESRGKESSGFAINNISKNEIHVIKAAVPSSILVMEEACKKFFKDAIGTDKGKYNAISLIGHSRLVTKGSEEDDANNQPIVKDGIVGIHNGIVVNDEALWENNPQLKREFEVDTEVMFALLRDHLNKNETLKYAASNTINEIYGTVSTAALLNDYQQILLATNNGSLYLMREADNKIILFASEKFILQRLLKNRNIREKIGESCIYEVEPNTGYVIDIKSLTLNYFKISEELKTAQFSEIRSAIPPASIKVINLKSDSLKLKNPVNILIDINNISIPGQGKLLELNIDAISKLRRCTSCLLPESFPNIHFDEKGVCNICNNYIPRNQPRSFDLLRELVAPYKDKSGAKDCIIPYSGGRDSTFTLHFIKKELGLNPISFIYDWGMVTDLARRNIARVCGKLGVENIIVSADIRKKRSNIQKNVLAWLKRPALGMIPLFMAGDKHFFYYTKQIQKQTGIKLNIWGINKLENTDFKVGFGGVDLQHNKERIYSLNMKQQLQLFSFISRNVITNPSYINSSIFDSMMAFYSRYFSGKKDYYHFFDFYKWDENEIINVLRSEYDWELAPDTKTSWRIGDGTAPFYNYIYYTVAGFTEVDAFRSNQIREGLISREEGLELTNIENIPRYQSIKWYLDILNIDFERTIKIINAIPKLYPL